VATLKLRKVSHQRFNDSFPVLPLPPATKKLA